MYQTVKFVTFFFSNLFSIDKIFEWFLKC